MRHALAIVLAGLLALAAAAHGASRGLHVHPDPDPAAPGAKVTLAINAAKKISVARVACDDAPPVETAPDPPKKRVEIVWTVPESVTRAVLDCRAEVETVSGETLHASALLRIERGDR